MDQRTQQPTVLLQGKRDKRSLAMTIGLAEATGIAVPLQGATPPRPLTHDLFLTLFGRLKVALTRVVITDLRNDTYYAMIYLTANGAEVQLDARPSDAIALAIRAKAPVLDEHRRPGPARRAVHLTPWPTPRSATTRSGRSSGASKTSSRSSARSSATSPDGSRHSSGQR